MTNQLLLMRFKYILYLFLSLISFSEIKASGDSWKKILKDKEGAVEFYWYPNNVILENSLDIIDGIEHDLAVSFINYLNQKHGLSIELKWIEIGKFEEVMRIVSDGTGGTFGASSISITEKRSKYVNYTTPYMADVSVLISNSKLPIALSLEELGNILEGNIAISITNSTLDESLNLLKNQLGIDFLVEYVSNSGNIIDKISKVPNSFGYVDIANFLVAVDNNEKIKRQFFMPIKLQGLALIYAKNSDWKKPVDDYFNSSQFEKDKQEIITRYLGSNASEIIDRISKSAEIGPLEEIVLSNREKEAQYERLLESAKRDQDSERLTLILVSIILVVLVVLSLLFALYRVKSSNNDRLIEQQKLVEQANDQLRALNEEKNNLIKVLAHDLRSPLANILNGSQIIESSEELSDQGKKLLGFILQSSEKMSSLIDKILDVDAIETGRHNLKIEQFELKPLLDQVVAENLSKAKEKSIKINLKPSDNPSVEADKVYTSQVVDNLISNAIKYSKVDSTIVVKAEEIDNMIKISVQDHGPGLTQDDQKKLFRKYQQLSARPTKGEASIGLGLSIVKLFTERMGGEVTYDTEVGKGTTFHVQLKKGNI